MIYIRYILILFFISTSLAKPLRFEDKLRISEAININQRYGDYLWKDITDIPFTILFVTDSLEYLIDHPEPTSDFIGLGFDEVLKRDIYFRKRIYEKDLLAAFPAVNGINTIVVGTPENTGKSSSEWIMAVLHEHFHQYTFSSAGYHDDLDSLNLRNDDWEGMWMINYNFPYSSEEVNKQFNAYSIALYNALNSVDSHNFKKAFGEFLIERNKLKNLLDPRDYRYLSFQHWQEGVARYTEYKFLESMEAYKPLDGVTSLTDYIPYTELKEKHLYNLNEKLLDPSLAVNKRLIFYYTGMAEALLLDKLNPSWRTLYTKDKFYLENYSSDFNK